MEWKPFDGEAAAEAVRREAKRAKEHLADAIDSVAEAAIERVKAESAALGAVPPDVAAFFARAEAVIVGEVSAPARQFFSGQAESLGVFLNVCLDPAGTIAQIPRARPDALPQLRPGRRYRMIAVFLPVEEQKP